LARHKRALDVEGQSLPLADGVGSCSGPSSPDSHREAGHQRGLVVDVEQPGAVLGNLLGKPQSQLRIAAVSGPPREVTAAGDRLWMFGTE
jgi:hypothetical protein